MSPPLKRVRAICLALPDVTERPSHHYFRPPYVGHRGWVGVRLDREVGWEEIAGVIEDAHETVARKR